MNSKLSFVFLFLLIACSCKEKGNSEDAHSAQLSTVVHIDDAKEFDPTWSKENTLIYHTTSEPDNLHPTNGNSLPRSEILFHTQQTLIRVDFEKQTLLPCLVKSMPEVSADGLEYTYDLRDDAKWDNGDPLLSGDVLFTAKASRCILTNNPATKLYWQNIKSFSIDPSTTGRFTIRMKNKNIQNISFFTSFSILQQSFYDPKNILSHYSFEQFDDTAFHADQHQDLVDWSATFNDDKYGRDPQFMNGLGPYKVQSWEAGQSITLVRKENYWGKGKSDYFLQSGPEKIIFRLNKDENSTQLEFKSQALDASTSFSTSSLIALQQDETFRKNYNYALTLTYNFTYIGFNERPEIANRKELFTDSKTRRALALLTPVDQLIRLVYKDYAADCKRMISNVSPLKKEFNAELKPLPFDAGSGKKMLLDAGWEDSDQDGFLDKSVNGKKIAFDAELIFLNTSSDWKDMASLIAQEYSKAGIKVTLTPLDLKLFGERARAHDYDLILGSWGATSLPEDYTQIWHSSSWKNHGNNYTGFGTNASDALIDSIKIELIPEKRIEMVHKLQTIIYEDQPCVFLYCSLRRVVVHKRFGSVSLYAERPGVILNTLKLLNSNTGISMLENPAPR
ncbi:MAG: hypothetical protein IPQ03_10925 [Bacteroidetes bacterium]|nr:hypothetical protein [Bacteroidota bacterium]